MIAHIIKLIWNKKGNNALLILEIFLSFLVLYAVLSYVLYNTDRLSLPLGFETENKWMVYLPNSFGRDTAEIAAEHESLRAALLEMDQIENVAFSNYVSPFGNSTYSTGSDDIGYEINFRYARVDVDFQKTMDIELLEGRWFNEGDEDATYRSVIVNRDFLDEFFEGRSMVDSIIPFEGELKIIGLVEDYRYGGIFEERQPTCFFYSPNTDINSRIVYLDMSPNTTVTYEEDVNNTIESVIKSANFVIQDVQTLSDRTTTQTWIPMIALLAISGFLCINVALGLFGVLWYNINKRKAEIGLRRALGASRMGIASQFTSEILLITGLAVILGIFFAIQVPLLKLIPIPPMIFYRAIIFSTLIILAIVTICALYPSTQASKIQPATALHED